MSEAEKRSSSPYTLLAEGYDVVMAHVDYVMWAEYILEILQHHHPLADEILELGCGTGALALVLQPAGGFTYTASDISEAMLAVARKKAEDTPIAFEQVDFRFVPSNVRYDAVLLLYDGINYVVESEEVGEVLKSTFRALKPGGVFIFDQSTPANSLNHSDGFDDAGRQGDFRYIRTSKYNPKTRLHTTLFRMDINGKTRTEQHIQRAYSLDQMRRLIDASPFELEASYDGFTFDPANDQSERVHHVLRRPLRS